MTYWDRIKQQLGINARDAREVLKDMDESYSVVLGGEPNVTLSRRAALGAKAGIWKWCVLCRLLSWLVQRNHCQETLDHPDEPAPVSVYIRAGLCFAVATVAVLGAVGVLIHWGVAAATAAATGAAALIGEMIWRRPGPPGAGS